MRAILLARATATTLKGSPRQELREPGISFRVLLGVAQHRTGSDHQNASQIAIPLFRDRTHSAWANIPRKRNRTEPICFSPHIYRARNLVERFFNKIEQCRRVATRYDKLAANYLAFIQLASIRLWLRVIESAP